MFFIAATRAAMVCSAAWRADTEIVRAFADRAAPGVAPESPRGLIPGAMTGFDGAITSARAGAAGAEAGAPEGLAAVASGFHAWPCASSRAAATISKPAAIPAAATVLIYFLAGGAAGGGGTGSENITRPLTSS